MNTQILSLSFSIFHSSASSFRCSNEREQPRSLLNWEKTTTTTKKKRTSKHSSFIILLNPLIYNDTLCHLWSHLIIIRKRIYIYIYNKIWKPCRIPITVWPHRSSQLAAQRLWALTNTLTHSQCSPSSFLLWIFFLSFVFACVRAKFIYITIYCIYCIHIIWMRCDVIHAIWLPLCLLWLCGLNSPLSAI